MKQDNSNEILNDVTTNDYKYGCNRYRDRYYSYRIERGYYPPYFGEEKGAGMVT